MRGGRKIHPVQLLKPETTKGGMGDKDMDYSAEYDCFAGVEPGGRIGGRKYKDDQDNTFGRVLIVFDYYPEFRANWRIKHIESDVTYKVMRLNNPDLRNGELQAECQSVDDI